MIDTNVKQYVRLKLIVYFENQLVLWKTARKVPLPNKVHRLCT